MRLADEFLIFTNVWGAIVDPKAFDERAFVRHKGDFCIIPPNSFVLGRSVEYFRIPREVICIVVGKSSYARCFRGDTRVALVNGTAPTLEEMARRWEKGERFFGYSVGAFGRIIVTELVAPRYIGRDSLLEITLDNGQKIHCTPDHLFLTRDGLMVPADDLRPGDRLMPLYRCVFRGYEMVYQPLTGCYYPTHRLADEWNLRHGIYPDLPNTHRHHLDGNRRNNMPCNIVRIRFWQDEKYQAARQALREKHRAYWTEERHQELSVAYRQWWEMSPERRQELVAEFRLQRNHQVVAIRELKGEHDVFCLTVPEAGNFALEAGVFVHNCGIVVNVTPLEPEWEGHVTIEISNTTPLPAKVYANEGIAQVIFLSADELCEVSYADRKGKYQGQQGIVPPKVE
jgi:dCTP deaminase